MNFKTKRILSLILAVLMCILALSACASEVDQNTDVTTPSSIAGDNTPDNTPDNTADNNTTPPVPDETNITPDLPEADFEEHKFNVLTRGQYSATWYSRDIYAEGLTGEVINDAVYARNKKIEDQYNFEIVEIGSNDPANVAKTSIMSNLDEYDMICIKIKDHITSLVNSGFLNDLKKLELMDLSQPYYDQHSMQFLSIANKQFAVTGDLLTMDNDATRCALFNKNLFNSLQLAQNPSVGDSLYNIVTNGKWTLDMLQTCSTLATADLNGDGQMDDEDQWGMANEGFNCLALYNASGNVLFEKDPTTDVPSYIAYNEKSISAFQRIIPLINSDFSKWYTDAYSEVHPFFQDGKILFHLAQLSEVSLYRAMEFDFGILPLPKYDETQDRYYSPVTAYGSNCISVPITASNLDRTATIIEALSCESMYTVTPAYYDVMLKGQRLRDEESVEMLDIILSTTMYELGYIWNWGGIYDTIYQSASNGNIDIASRFKTMERMCNKAIESTIKAMEQAG